MIPLIGSRRCHLRRGHSVKMNVCNPKTSSGALLCHFLVRVRIIVCLLIWSAKLKPILMQWRERLIPILLHGQFFCCPIEKRFLKFLARLEIHLAETCIRGRIRWLIKVLLLEIGIKLRWMTGCLPYSKDVYPQSS